MFSETRSLNLTTMGGLCSRLRAVLAAGDWCDRHEVSTLQIAWPRREPNLAEFGGFALPLEDLFELPDNWYTIDSEPLRPPKQLPETGGVVVPIRTCHPESFDPPSTAALIAQLGKMAPRFNPANRAGCIGVNLRWSLREGHDYASTPEWFARRAMHVSDLTGCRDIFLVADSADAYSRFMSEITLDITIHENVRLFDYDANGIAWQCQEMYELASTKFFIGAANSSYSQTDRKSVV